MLSKTEILKNIQFKTQNKNFLNIEKQNPFTIFDQKIIDFFDEISKKILKKQKLKKYPDLVSFGFFCRKVNLVTLSKLYLKENCKRSGRGVSLHYPPTNVPLNFAYSLLVGLLSGNICLIRIGTNNFKQTNELISIINIILKKKKFTTLKKKIYIFNYLKSKKNINDYLSKICDIRVIWGGNESINEIRNSKLQPHAYDITFPNKISILVVNATEYLKCKEYLREAENFYNDTYTFDQNACTSPRLIYWIGSKKNIYKAREIFWNSFVKIIKKKSYVYGSITGRLVKEMSAIIELKVKDSNKEISNKYSSLLLKKLPKNLSNYISPGGFFLEFCAKDFHQLRNIITIETQTITILGYEVKPFYKSISSANYKGIFRIVKNGRASDFNLVWDGYDLIGQMSKRLNFISF
tara:strand:- start:273 stop:1496 length:1224 start_codon:yes stop_codon:yes gene_type:complete